MQQHAVWHKGEKQEPDIGQDKTVDRIEPVRVEDVSAADEAASFSGAIPMCLVKAANEDPVLRDRLAMMG